LSARFRPNPAWVFFRGALTRNVQQPEAAGALLRFLASAEAALVISKAGLMPPS